jgi:hypothetical protein
VQEPYDLAHHQEETRTRTPRWRALSNKPPDLIARAAPPDLRAPDLRDDEDAPILAARHGDKKSAGDTG